MIRILRNSAPNELYSNVRGDLQHLFKAVELAPFGTPNEIGLAIQSNLFSPNGSFRFPYLLEDAVRFTGDLKRLKSLICTYAYLNHISPPVT